MLVKRVKKVKIPDFKCCKCKRLLFEEICNFGPYSDKHDDERDYCQECFDKEKVKQ